MSDVTLKIGANANQASAELNKLENDVKGIGDAFKGLLELGALTAVFTKLTDVIGTTIGAFSEADSISNKLNQSLVNQGIYSAELRGRYDELANSIQKKTKFDDDSTKAGIAVAQGFLGQIEITEELTTAVADLAEAQGMDLQSAFALVGKSIGGPTNQLARYGVQIDKSKTKAEQMEQAVRNLNAAFGGQAEAAGKSLEGSLAKLNNAWGDAAEVIGKQFAPAVSAAADALTSIITYFNENEALAKWVAIILGATTAIVGLATAVVGVTFVVGTFGAVLSAAIWPITLVVAAITGLAVAWETNFLGIQEITFGVWEAIKSLFGDMMKAFGGLRDVMVGLFTGDLDLVKKGLSEFGQAHLDAINNTVKAYKKGRDEKLAAMTTEDKSEAELLKKSEERAKIKAGLPAEQTEAEKKALDEQQKAEDEAAKKSFDRRERMLEDQLKRINDEKEAEFDSLDLIEEDRQEADALLDQLHQLRLERIEELKLAEVQRIEEIKSAEQDLSDAKRDLDQKAGVRQKKRLDFEQKETAGKVNTALGFAGNVLDGRAGAVSAVSSAAGLVGDAFLPGIGGAVGGIVGQLARGPEENKKMVKEFVEALPEIIEAVAASVPVVVEALVDSLINDGGLIRIAEALLRAAFGAQILEAIGAQLGLDFGSSLNSSNIAETFGEKVFKPIGDGFQKIGEFYLDFYTKVFEFIIGGFNDFLDEIFAFELPEFKTPGWLVNLIDGIEAFTTNPPWIEWLQDIADQLSSVGDFASGEGGEGGLVSGTGTPLDYLNQGKIGLTPKYAAQGFFPGTPRGSDSIPIWAGQGESIINARSTAANRGMLEKINNSGGPVEDGGEIVLRVSGDYEVARFVERILVEGSTFGTSRIRVAVGGET